MGNKYCSIWDYRILNKVLFYDGVLLVGTDEEEGEIKLFYKR